MNVAQDQIQALLELQEVDREALRLQREFEGLPQRQKILDARAKRQQLAEKAEAVKKMHAAAEAKIQSIVDEDERLGVRMAEIQRDIDEAGGDFRNMEARSKELAGQTRRREALVPLLEQAEGELAKVEAVEGQLAAAIKKVDAAEASAIESFRRDGTELQMKMARAKAERDELAATVDADLIGRYGKIAQASGGVAIGVLADGRCGSCRAPIDDVRLVEVRRQAPLAICPHCKRMLVVG